MRGKTRRIQHQTINDLFNAMRELNNQQSYRYQDQLKLIVGSAFGIDQEKGLLTNCIEYYLDNPPVNWIVQYEKINNLFDPSSEFIRRLIVNCDSPAVIDVRQIPKCVLAPFPEQGTYQSRLMRSLRREVNGNFTVNLWEWYWISLVNAFLGLQEFQDRRSLQDQERQDEFFTHLSRNLYLVFLRKIIKYLTSTNSRLLLQRLLNIIEFYLVEQLIFKFANDRKDKQIQVKYRLRSHFLQLFYLLIHGRDNKLTQETVQLYYDFILKISDHYSSVTTPSTNQNIKNIIRVWIGLITRDVTLESNLLGHLSKANKTDGWFKLGRCPLQEFKRAVQRTEIPLKQISKVQLIRTNILRLLKKYNQWTPCYSFYASLEQFMVFDQIVLSRLLKIQQSSDAYEQEIIPKCLERLIKMLRESGANQQLIKLQCCKISTVYRTYYNRDLGIQFEQQIFQNGDSKPLSRTSIQRQKQINFQTLRTKSVWEYPIQHNQFYLLYRLFYEIAKALDRFIPGQKNRKYPYLNLRILSNPFVFFFIIVVCLLLLKL